MSLPRVGKGFAAEPVRDRLKRLPRPRTDMKFPRIITGFAVSLLVIGAARAQTISDFSPKFASPGENVTIVGSGFSTGTMTVRFWNGVLASATPTTDATIIATVPAGAAVGPISVRRNSNTPVFSLDNFTPIGAGPYVAGFSPWTGSAGVTNILTGAHFTGVTAVKFNGVTAPFFYATEDGLLQARAPNNVTTGPMTVTTPSGTFVTTSNFFVPPVVTGFAPTNGRAGTNVLIKGTNFLGATAVRFNGLDASTFSVLSNNAIQATVPVGATTGFLQVFAPAGSYPTSSNLIIQPTFSGFTPGFGPAGTPVTITGANLNVGTPTVKFGTIAATIVSNITFSSLVAVVPPGAITSLISVTTTNGSMTNAATFYVPPILTSFIPSNSPPGSLVAVSGTNFTDTSAVNFNGTPAAAFYVTNNNSLGAVVPAGITSGPISITTPGGTTNSAARFYGAPSIGSFNPTHGLPGTNVTITGLNFLDATVVRFNGSNTSFSVINNTTINAFVPTNVQTGPITVIAPAGTNTSAQSFVLDYSANISVTVSDTPDPVVIGDSLTYTIIVANSGPFAAPGVTLTGTLIGPALLTSATTTQGTLTTNTSPITGALGQINVGGAVFVTLTVIPQADGPITNLVTVASQLTDPVTANNSATSSTYVQPLPRLTVQRVGADRVRVSWNAALTNYALEFKPLLATTNFWSNVVTVPLLIGSEYQLTETNNQPMRYYRLHRVP